MSSLVVNKLISTDSIKKIDAGKMIVEAHNKKSEIKFVTPRAQLVFAKLR